ncbi:MAG TPA: ribosome recycling factor [Nitrospiria bacterium]|jgi:ribosome recycling factor|nr:ribosome recycling factor [Nitrospiria bacterium]
MLSELKTKAREKMDQVLEHLRRDLAGVRTGRASLALLDSIQVSYYGSPTPLKQVAALAVPDPRLITIQPWEVSLIPEIEKAITTSNLGLNPTNDGKLIRLTIPSLTEERRKELVKQVKKIGEDTKVRIRNVRRDTNEEIKKFLKDSKISEDDQRKGQDEIQKTTDQYITKIDEMIKKKEAEVLEV